MRRAAMETVLIMLMWAGLIVGLWAIYEARTGGQGCRPPTATSSHYQCGGDHGTTEAP